MWAKTGDELAICQGTGSGYGTRRTLTDSHSVGWVLSTGQSGYLGANSATNHGNSKPTSADLPVIKAVKSDATTSTTGYYYYYTTTAVANVGSVEFSYTANSGNSNATAYVVVGDAVSANGGDTYEIIELSSASTSKQGDGLSTSGTFTYTFSDTQTSARYYGFIIVTSSYKRMTAGTIKLLEGAPANQVKAPSITMATGPFVSTKVISMESATAGASIYYTTNGDTPTTSSTLYDSSNKPVISATTTIKAIAVKAGMDNSSVSAQTFTKETVLDGISALNSATTGTEKTQYVKLTNAQITYVESATGYNGFLNDADAGIYLYLGSGNDLTLNTKYNGVYKITSKTYYSWARVTKFEAIAGEGTSEVASDMAPVVMTASALEENFSANLSRQIRINNHTLTEGNLTSNITIPSAYQGGSLTEDGTYTLIGYPSVYNSGKRFYVVNAYPKPAAPTFDPVEGEFSESFTLHLACATDGVAIYYTTDGTTPTTSSTPYNDATGIAISTADVTVKAIAYYQDMTSDVASATYTYRAVAKPLFGIVSGTEVYYGTKISVTCATDGAGIYYTLTTDGSEPADPTNASTAYPDGGIAINKNTVKIKVVAEKNGDYSSIAAATYTLKDPAEPVFSPVAGAVPCNTVVTISSAEGTTIFYTTDGSDADTGTDASSNSVKVAITEGMTLKAIAVDPELNMSAEASATYTIAHVATPIVEPAEGILSKGTQVTITTATDGATIYYTLDGETPTASSNVYNGYVVINKACTLKAIALKENYIDSEVASATYTVAGANEAVVFENEGYSNGDDVTNKDYTKMSLAWTGSPKYYTSDKTARLYNNGTLTVSSTDNITAIVFSLTEGGASLGLSSGESGEISGSATSQIWTGTAKSIKFKATATVKIKSITVFYELTDDNVTVGSSKLAGFCSEYKLDFSGTGLSAYKAKVSDGKVVLTKVADGIVPANTGVILTGDANDYDLPISTADVTTDFSDNEMVGVSQRTQVLWNPSTDVYNYILQGGEFKKASTGFLKANRAYLSTSYNVTAAGARDYMEIVFEDEPTAIRGIENGELRMENSFYDLQGRKVAQPTKGLYIVNGKKVVVK